MKRPFAGGSALVVLGLVTVLRGQIRTTTYSAAQPPAVVIEPVFVKQIGSYPVKIVRPVGPFVLFVANWLPQKALHFSLSLDSAATTEVIGVNTTLTTNKATLFLDLLPGNYHLTIQGNSNWSLPIQIQTQ